MTKNDRMKEHIAVAESFASSAAAGFDDHGVAPSVLTALAQAHASIALAIAATTEREAP